MSNEANEPAFPLPIAEGYPTAFGLTKREYFAGLAMQAQMRNLSDTLLRANIPVSESEFATVISRCAEVAVKYANALLAELEKTNGK